METVSVMTYCLQQFPPNLTHAKRAMTTNWKLAHSRTLFDRSRLFTLSVPDPCSSCPDQSTLIDNILFFRLHFRPNRPVVFPKSFDYLFFFLQPHPLSTSTKRVSRSYPSHTCSPIISAHHSLRHGPKDQQNEWQSSFSATVTATNPNNRYPLDTR